MEKKYLVRFLREKKRGAYTILVKHYIELIDSAPISILSIMIKEDLEKCTGERVELNYFSLARSIARLHKKKLKDTSTEFHFRDANEIASSDNTPGRFKL